MSESTYIHGDPMPDEDEDFFALTRPGLVDAEMTDNAGFKSTLKDIALRGKEPARLEVFHRISETFGSGHLHSIRIHNHRPDAHR